MPTQNKITLATSDREVILLWLADKSKTTQVSYGSILKHFLEFLGDKQLYV
jgi:integrase/recombinase XerD